MSNLIDIINTVSQAESNGKAPAELANLYEVWLNEFGRSDESAPAWFNYGCLLSTLQQRELAEKAYQTALSLKPNFWQACVNLGLSYEAKGQIEHVKHLYKTYLIHHSDIDSQTEIRNQLGRILEGERDYTGAVEQYSESLKQKPEQSDVFQHWFYLRQKQCDWPIEKFETPLTQDSIATNIGPIASMAHFDDPALLKSACDAWVSSFKKGKQFLRLAPDVSYAHDRIRIGYVSCDFRAHACCFLNAQMFASHDRSKFEVFAFDFSKEEDTDWRKIVLHGMDQVHPIHNLTDEQSAKLIRELEIDVLVDLVGLTSGARPGIFMHRPAPIQISYLGFLGPTGDREIDYLVADPYVIPPQFANAYGVKPLYVDFYQVNNRLRLPEKENITRLSAGLPEKKFIYCAINNSYKIKDNVFDRWISILKKTPDSVLWLLEDNADVKINIHKYAKQYQIDSSRIIFSERVIPNIYLARFGLADLFLDSSPYNAGVTATDALWAGLPVLSCPGNTYVSRMAGSLLKTLDLEEFICKTWSEYEDKAVKFYWTRDAKKILQDKQIHKNQIFDTKTFVKQFEDKIIDIVANRNQSEIPTDISQVLPPLSAASPDKITNFSTDTYWGVSDPVKFKHLLDQAKQLTVSGYFLGDNLFTWLRNNSALEDSHFKTAWQDNIQNSADEAIVWRRYILACAAFHCLNLKGDFVECGVYIGSGMKTIIDYLGKKQFPKRFYGYDTFDYNPVGHTFSEQKEGLFEKVLERFSGYDQVRLVKGLIPSSFAIDSPDLISYLHIDLNNAEAEIATLESLFNRVVSGGVIILDDYEWAGVYRPQKIQEDSWFSKRNYRVFPLPTGQGIVLKR